MSADPICPPVAQASKPTEPNCNFTNSTLIIPAGQRETYSETADTLIHTLPLAPPEYCNLVQIGNGATSIVYSATESVSGKVVALKRLKPNLAKQPEIVESFLSEAAILFGLRHPHIIRCFDFFFFEGTWWIVLEYADGGTLAAASRTHMELQSQRRRWFSQLADAIQYLHDRGIVHRDIKPTNILIRDGIALLADFGVASRPSDSRKQRSHVCGTLRFMSIEAAAGSISPNNDWFAFARTAEDTGLTDADVFRLPCQ